MRNKLFWAGIFVISGMLAGRVAAEDVLEKLTEERNTRTAEVTIDFSESRSYSPALFGQNLEYFAIAQGLCRPADGKVLPQVAEELRKLQIPQVRFPGGTLSNFYHWRDAIGRQSARGKGRRTDAKHDATISMVFGTDEFFAFLRDVGAQKAMITVNIPTSPNIEPWMGTAQEAAAWVAYCNAGPDNQTVIGKDANGVDWGTAGDWATRRAENGSREPYAVTHWELGNEIYTEIKDPKFYAAVCREFAQAMKAVDPTIRLGVVCKDSDFGKARSDWNETVLAETRGATDFLVTHFYLPGIDGLNNDGTRVMSARDVTRITMLSPDRFRRQLANLRAAVERQVPGRKDFGIGITEFACNLRRDAETDKTRLSLIRSQQAALYVADALLAFLDAGVEVGNYWTLRGWAWSLLELSDGRAIPQGAWFAYRLFGADRQSEYSPAKVRSGEIILHPRFGSEFGGVSRPALTAGATVNQAKTVGTVLLVNRALDRSTEVTIRLNGLPHKIGQANLEVLAAPPEAVNTASSPDALQLTSLPVQSVPGSNVLKCTLPPCSIGKLVFSTAD